MKNNALYYPTITLAKSTWLTQVLLYWDKLYSIIPTDYNFGTHPQQLFTRELLNAGLLEPLRPGPRLQRYPHFRGEFIDYIQRRQQITRRRRPTAPVDRTTWIRVHAEKMQEIGDQLVDLELAERGQDFWYTVEPKIANEFVTYLAVGLGQQDDVDATPVTDHLACFDILKPYCSELVPALREERTLTRDAILAAVLPAPPADITLRELGEFKREQGGRLKNFRARVEKECIDAANITNRADREERQQSAIAALAAERDVIVQAMSRRWINLILGPLAMVVSAGLSLVGATGGIAQAGAGGRLLSTVFQGFRTEGEYRNLTNGPLAYAAFFKRRFGPH